MQKDKNKIGKFKKIMVIQIHDSNIFILKNSCMKKE